MKKLSVLFLVFLLGCSGKKSYNIGILIGVEQNIEVAESFINKMIEYGYIQGDNINYDIQDGKSNSELMDKICADFVRKKVDLILSITHGASQAAKKATEGSGIPVVFSYAITNRGGLVDSIAEPGGNVTGVRYPIPDMAVKRFEFLMEINPDIENVLLIYKEAYPPALIVIEGLKDIAKDKGIIIIEKPLASLDEMAEYFRVLEEEKTGIDSIIILPEPFAYSDRGWNLIRDFSYKHNIPIAANSFHMSRKGALFSYTNKDEEMGELAAPLVDKIFNGADIGKIPVVTPKIYLHINMDRADELGVKFPDSMLKMAAEVIDENQ